MYFGFLFVHFVIYFKNIKRNKKVKNVDVEQYFDKSGKELKKLGFKKNNSGKYENEDGSIVIEMKDDAVSSISMNSECKSEFHGIKIGDEYEKIETAFGDTYPLIGADEGGDLYGNIETGTQIYIRTARNKVRTITIDLNCDLSGYEDSDTIFTDVIFCERKEWIGIEERSSA